MLEGALGVAWAGEVGDRGREREREWEWDGDRAGQREREREREREHTCAKSLANVFEY